MWLAIGVFSVYSHQFTNAIRKHYEWKQWLERTGAIHSLLVSYLHISIPTILIILQFFFYSWFLRSLLNHKFSSWCYFCSYFLLLLFFILRLEFVVICVLTFCYSLILPLDNVNSNYVFESYVSLVQDVGVVGVANTLLLALTLDALRYCWTKTTSTIKTPTLSKTRTRRRNPVC